MLTATGRLPRLPHQLKRLFWGVASFMAGLVLPFGTAHSMSFDFIDAAMPFPAPAVSAPATLPGISLPEQAVNSLRARKAFFAGNFTLMESVLEREHESLLARQTSRGSDLVNSLIEETQLAGIDRCREWIAKNPRSYSAHWTCGAMWYNGAWVARSSKYSKDVSPAQFTLMRDRLLQAQRLLETAASLTERPVEAYSLLAATHSLLGEHAQAENDYSQAEKAAAWYAPLHEARINFSQPSWGGSPKAVAKAIARAEKSGVDPNIIADFRDSYEARPWDTPTPGAEKDYWIRALASRPTWERAHGLAKYHWRLNHWQEMLAATERMLSLDPNRAEGYHLRAIAYENLANLAAALADYQKAASLGQNLATDRLIRVHIQGHLGQPAQNWPALDTVCRYGAALGVPAAANCLGGAYLEATAETAPFRKDIQQGYAWHLLASRGGYANSQHDLGWMLFTGRAPGVNPATGKRVGLFWLRRAAEQGHTFAIRKLEAAHIPLSEPVPEPLPTPPLTKPLLEIRL